MFIIMKWKSFLKAISTFTMLFITLAVLGSMRQISPETNEVFSSSTSNRTLIIDAGHGGVDGGAVGIDGTVESEINLEIALKLRDLAKFCGENVVMTRSASEIDYPEESASIAAKKLYDQKYRVELINSIPNAWLISIHQNTYINDSANGAQVFYGNKNNSEAVANFMQSQLNATLYENSRRLAAPISDSVYLMKKVNCEAILVECGFISNENDLNQLKNNDFQTKLALTILTAWEQNV